MQAELHEHIDALVPRGQTALSNCIGCLLRQRIPGEWPQLQTASADILLEPALFAAITNVTNANATNANAALNDASHALPLTQQLAGLINPLDWPAPMTVLSDCHGNIYLPRLGTLTVSTHNRYGIIKRRTPHSFEFQPVSTDRQCRVNNSGEIVTLQPEQRLPAGGPRVSQQIPAVWWQFFESAPSGPSDSAPPLPKDCLTTLTQAWTLLEQLHPSLFYWIKQVTQFVGLYQAPSPNSFAGIRTHGAVFLNVPPKPDVTYFIDDLSHQCGHVIFNVMTYPVTDFLTVARDTPLASLFNADDDPRTLYSAFHGLFTYSLILECLDRYHTHSAASPQRQRTALARIAFYLSKFAEDLETLAQPQWFTPAGWAIVSSCQQIFLQMWQRYSAQCRFFDLSNQPYVFNWPLFCAANPPRQTQARQTHTG